MVAIALLKVYSQECSGHHFVDSLSPFIGGLPTPTRSRMPSAEEKEPELWTGSFPPWLLFSLRQILDRADPADAISPSLRPSLPQRPSGAGRCGPHIARRPAIYRG